MTLLHRYTEAVVSERSAQRRAAVAYNVICNDVILTQVRVQCVHVPISFFLLYYTNPYNSALFFLFQSWLNFPQHNRYRPGVGVLATSWSTNCPSCISINESTTLTRATKSSSVMPEALLIWMLTTRAVGRGLEGNSDTRGSCRPDECSALLLNVWLHSLMGRMHIIVST